MILEMALAFTSMGRVFSKKSTSTILDKLRKFFDDLAQVVDQEGYDRLHSDFCDWFTRNISLAPKKETEKRAAIGPRSSSYGEAAKVLDVVAKVYVYYCGQPSCATAPVLLPMLHGALDNKMVRRLREQFPKARITAKSLTEVNKAEYEKLQSVVAQEIEDAFDAEICRVQYDDIVFRRLNRN